jgi:hypothetical protein
MGFQHAVKVGTHIVLLWNKRDRKRPDESVVLNNKGIYGELRACIGAVRVQFPQQVGNIKGFAIHAEVLAALVCGCENDAILKGSDGGTSGRRKRGDSGRVGGKGVSGKVCGSSSEKGVFPFVK